LARPRVEQPIHFGQDAWRTRFLSRLGVQAVHHTGEITLEEVGVDVESDLRRAISELQLDRFHVGAGVPHQGHASVPKVVRGDVSLSVPAIALAGVTDFPKGAQRVLWLGAEALDCVVEPLAQRQAGCCSDTHDRASRRFSGKLMFPGSVGVSFA
jgi:hypothetical protein